MSISTLIFRRSLPIAAAVLLLAGCAQSAEEAVTEASIAAATGHEVDVERDGEQVTIKTDEGDIKISEGESLALPADFPEDVYLPRSYKVRSVMGMGGTQMLNLSAPGSASKLFAEARDTMARNHWTLSMAMQHDSETSVLAFEKAQRAAVLSFSGSDGDGVEIGMQLRQSQQ